MDKSNRPIIICGAARSGTTFLWQLLNEHPDILLSDEYFIYKTPSMITWFEEMGEAFGTLTARGDWADRKASIMRLLWYLTSQPAKAEPGLTSRRWGNKTPGAEMYFDFYENVFEGCPPFYIYCLRDPRKVFLSTRNMAWGKNSAIKGQVNRYLKSVAAMENFREANPDRLSIFQVDLVPEVVEARLEVIRDLLSFVGEELPVEMEPVVKTWKPVLSTKQVRRKDPGAVMEELPENDRIFLEKHTEIQRILQTYGYAEV